MAEIVEAHLPCSDCGSSDAKCIYADGSTFCFSCKTYHKGGGKVTLPAKDPRKPKETIEDIRTYDCRGFEDRGITKKVAEYFGCKVGYDSNRVIVSHYYPYGDTGFKVRHVANKTFHTVGDCTGLFGRGLFNGGKRLVITEGELDAMAVAQAWADKYGTIYPTVSVSSAAHTEKVLLANRDWCRQFDEVILWFDNDDPGKEASKVAARIIGYDKVKVAVTNNGKDACDAFKAGGFKAVVSCIYDAQRYTPSGIVRSGSTWDQFKSQDQGVYIEYASCFGGLNANNFGRRLGSITLLAAGTGVGKSSFVTEDIYHLLKNTDMDIGICALESSVTELTTMLMSAEANQRIGLPTVKISDEDERRYWDATMGTDRIVMLDHQGSADDGTIIDSIEYMLLCGCRFIWLDHITIAVSESGGETNGAMDSMMSSLLKLVKRYNSWIGVVSHLRKRPNGEKSFEEGAVPTEDDLKGSGSLKQIPMQTIALSRNKYAEDAFERNTQYVWVLKDRYTGHTGPVGSVRYVPDTGRVIMQSGGDSNGFTSE
jgi:twinkle protein